jgi:protein-disulfide isomerase
MFRVSYVRIGLLLPAVLLLAGLAGCKAAGDPEDCKTFTDKVCAAAGEGGAACQNLRQTVELLTPAACTAALADIDTTLAKLKEQRASCDQLVTKLCADLGESTDSCRLVREKTPEFPSERCEQMLKSYANVLEELQRRELANQPLDAAKQATIAAGNPPAFGPANAKVTLVEFSDFQCPYCSRAAVATKEVKQKYGDKVRFIFRQFPLNFHPDAHLAAQAALAANAQGKFWAFHDLAYENQKALGRADLEKYAQQLGLDVNRFKRALDSGEFKAMVDADVKLGEEVAVNGTPTLFLNGKRVADPTDAAFIGKAIDEALAN